MKQFRFLLVFYKAKQMSQEENMTMVDWIEAERVRKAQQKTVYDPALDQSRGKWTRCDQCGEILYIKHIRLEHMVCSKCEFPLQMAIQDRIHMLLDEGSWRPMDEWLSPADPMSFYDSRPYTERLVSAQEETGLQDAVQTGTGLMEGMPLALGVMDFNFMGGSMGSVVGEKITRLIEHATKQGLPLLLITASGGARMQEGVLSLMQMAKISAALHVHQNCAQLPYWSLLTHPTTGGVTASFAMLGDLVLAEPRAMIAFAGRRVIQETLGEVLPENFQTAEYLMEHGLLDLIIERRYHREAFAELVLFHHYAPRRKRGHLPHGYNGPMNLLREERLRRSLQLGQASFEPLLQSFAQLLRASGREDTVKRDELLQGELWSQAQKEGVMWNLAPGSSVQIEWQGLNRPTWPEWPTEAELEPITLPDGRLQYPITSDVQRDSIENVQSELETLERAIWRATCSHLQTTK